MMILERTKRFSPDILSLNRIIILGLLALGAVGATCIVVEVHRTH